MTSSTKSPCAFLLCTCTCSLQVLLLKLYLLMTLSYPFNKCFLSESSGPLIKYVLCHALVQVNFTHTLHHIRHDQLLIFFVVTSLQHIGGLMQEKRNSIANALELRLSCTKPSIWLSHCDVTLSIAVIVSYVSMNRREHYSDVIISTVYSGADQRRYQSSASLAFVRGIHRWTVNSPPKGPVTRKMFPFADHVMRQNFRTGCSKKIQLWNVCIIGLLWHMLASMMANSFFVDHIHDYKNNLIRIKLVYWFK